MLSVIFARERHDALATFKARFLFGLVVFAVAIAKQSSRWLRVQLEWKHELDDG